MIPVVQSIVGDGKDGRRNGDCFRACVASIFELPLEAVPNFIDPSPIGWWIRLQTWLRPMGLAADHEDHPPDAVPARITVGWWIASVASENLPGERHAVVMHGTETAGPDDNLLDVAHDPSPHPRRTPYVFLGATWLVAADPAAIARRAR